MQTISRAATAGRSPNRIIAQGITLGGILLLFCALKEQKEVANTHRKIIPIALSERKLLGSLFPRVLPWAVILLGLRPVFAYNIDCCTTP